MKRDNGTYPKGSDKKDVLLGLVKAGVSAIPVAGGPITELLNQILTPSLQKRRDEWFEAVGEDLAGLQSRFENLEKDLQDREDFTTIVIYSSQIAVRTHQTEKIVALPNIVKNTALNLNPAEDLSMTYLGILDALTPSHLQIFQIIGEHKIGFEILNTTWSNIDSLYAKENDKFAQLSRGLALFLKTDYSVDFTKQILIELMNKGLIEEIDDDTKVALPSTQPRIIRQTRFGRDFLRFTSDSSTL